MSNVCCMILKSKPLFIFLHFFLGCRRKERSQQFASQVQSLAMFISVEPKTFISLHLFPCTCTQSNLAVLLSCFYRNHTFLWHFLFIIFNDSVLLYETSFVRLGDTSFHSWKRKRKTIMSKLNNIFNWCSWLMLSI